MNYWWRLFAHLAPYVPGTALLAYVERKARAGAPEYQFPRWELRRGEARRLFRAMLEVQDDDRKLRRMTSRWEHLVAIHARDTKKPKQEAFRVLYSLGVRHRRALTMDEYNYLFRFVTGPKWNKRRDSYHVRDRREQESRRSP